MDNYFFVLDEAGNPVPVPEEDHMTWATWYATAERHIGDTSFLKERIRVSTVFLSLNHAAYYDKQPVLFETMVFASEAVLKRLLELAEYDDRSIMAKFIGGIDIQKRYHTRQEAEEGHQRMCHFIEVCLMNGFLTDALTVIDEEGGAS